MRRVFFPIGAGLCAKKVVTATVVAPDGRQWQSSNYCMNPQEECPRGSLPRGVGYDMCKDICQQHGHAEIEAMVYAAKDGVSLNGAVIYLEGIGYACSRCETTASFTGIKEIIVGTPPQSE